MNTLVLILNDKYSQVYLQMFFSFITMNYL